MTGMWYEITKQKNASGFPSKFCGQSASHRAGFLCRQLLHVCLARKQFNRWTCRVCWSPTCMCYVGRVLLDRTYKKVPKK